MVGLGNHEVCTCFSLRFTLCFEMNVLAANCILKIDPEPLIIQITSCPFFKPSNLHYFSMFINSTPLLSMQRDYPNTGTMYEDSNDSGGECGIPTTIRFPSPDASHSDLPSHGWWSLQHGSALIIMLNSEMSLFKGSDQYRWLRHTLTHHNRSEAPWIIITIHRPVYGLRNIPGGVIIEEKLFDLEDLIHEQKVDLLIVGHEHNSYVSCPMYKQKCKLPNIEGGYAAPIHLCSGNGGQHITPINATATIPWIQYKAAQFGYSSLEFHNQTHLSITMYSDDPASNFEGYKQTIFRRWPRDKHGT